MLYKYKGDCLANLGTYEAAFSSYANSVSYNPDFYDAFWQRGYYKYFLGKYDEAIDDYNKAIIIVEATGSSGNKIDLASLYNTKANILIAQKKQSVAIAAIGKAIEIDPNNVTYYSTSAALYKQMKDFTKAQVEYEKAITVETDNKKKSSLYLNRSMMEWSYLDYASCLKDINKAIESDPENGMNFWHRSIVNGYKKNYTMAIKDCNTALELYKNDSIYTPSLYWLRADHKTRSGDYKGAMDDYRLYAKYYPESYSIYYELGRLYKKKLKNMDLANANLAKAARLAWEAKDTSKYCYIKVIEGDKIEPFKLQTDQILNSLTDDYQYKWELHNMACLYSLSGNVAKGLEYLEKSMEAGFDDYLHLVNDRDLELLMKQPRWKTFLSKYKMPLVKQ
ncbi:MAG: hypothetical protein IT248_11470 [Chitinophagaceae bacterium]|jgi:tetratricopeptide (TPR) repeat protein|nr:hypothetical protein [Chitinophagaceae bacterium]